MGLKINNIVKKYGDKTVVNGISFAIDNPGVYALLGTNGAGKTTTIRIILGMIDYESGSVKWNDKDINASDINIGYLAEERGLYPKYSLMDQLIYFGRLRGMNTSDIKKAIKYWSERLEVEKYVYPDKKKKYMKADQLSKGNQQKIQLMAALISNPELIILDEPLSGLDPVNAELFKSIIHEEINKEKYIIMSSHQMSTIEEFCSDITIMNKGNAVLQGNLNEIKKSYGRINLELKCDSDIKDIISRFEFTDTEYTPDGYSIRLREEEQAMSLLKELMNNNIDIVSFQRREPSLHEIFIEKVGESNEK